MFTDCFAKVRVPHAIPQVKTSMKVKATNIVIHIILVRCLKLFIQSRPPLLPRNKNSQIKTHHHSFLNSATLT